MGGNGAAEGAAGARWREAGKDLARAVSGGMIVGIALMYTVEVWWAGANVTASHLTVGLLACLVPVFLVVLGSGFWGGLRAGSATPCCRPSR
ncbi:DUF2391 family protein [Streptomyces radiopugnans]|uniref:DUF2391 family protein n=1 Tax=Streptomyces radiopugnans TaxID=403935 RepID=UPI003F1A26B9